MKYEDVDTPLKGRSLSNPFPSLCVKSARLHSQHKNVLNYHNHEIRQVLLCRPGQYDFFNEPRHLHSIYIAIYLLYIYIADKIVSLNVRCWPLKVLCGSLFAILSSLDKIGIR